MTEEEMNDAVDWLRQHPGLAQKQATAQREMCSRCSEPLDCWVPVFTTPKEFVFICAKCSETPIN